VSHRLDVGREVWLDFGGRDFGGLTAAAGSDIESVVAKVGEFVKDHETLLAIGYVIAKVGKAVESPLWGAEEARLNVG